MKQPMEDASFRQEFERIYYENSGRIYNYVLRISQGNSYLAEEILQTSFMKLWEHRDSIRNVEGMLSYLYTVAKNTFLNYCEHEAVQYVYSNYIQKNESEEDHMAESSLDSVFMERFFDEMVAYMPPVRQKIFLMSRKRNMTNKEIADDLQISEHTVETHLSLALKYLKKKMQIYYNVWLPFILLVAGFIQR